MTIVRFNMGYLGGWHRYTCLSDDTNDMSGEYVPLAEYQALEAHMKLLAKETYELKGLLRRVVERGWTLVDEFGDGWNAQSPQLAQLLGDCQEVLA